MALCAGRNGGHHNRDCGGAPKLCDVTEEQFQGLLCSDPGSVSMEHDSLCALKKKMLELWLVKTQKR